MTDPMLAEAGIDVSLVIEWEHVSEGEAERPVEMLRQVVAQTAEVDKKVEAIVAYDPEVTDSAQMEQIFAMAGLRDAPHLDVRLEPAPGHRYYALKNVGGQRARGAIVVLMDSDVIPADGWLRELLKPFEDPSVQIVSGQIYVGPPKSTYWKTFSLFWLFHLEDKDAQPGFGKIRGYHANNGAFRREIFVRHQFRPGVRITPIAEQCAEIAAAGVRVYYAPSAHLVHPAPRDLADMRTYAFSAAYDRAAKRMGSWPRRVFWVFASWLPLGLDLVRYTERIVPAARRRAVGLGVRELPQALAIAYFYALLRWAGFVLTMVAPDVIPEKHSTGSSLAGWSLERVSRPERSVIAG